MRSSEPGAHTPAPGDVVIAKDMAAKKASFALSVVPGPAQIRCQTFEQALSTAGAWMSQHQIAIWFTENGTTFTRVAPGGSPMLEDLLRRVEGEYLEMPGLQLTPEQAQRLWALDLETCATIFEILVERQFLIRGSDDRYRRVGESDSPSVPRRMAKADLVLRVLDRRQN